MFTIKRTNNVEGITGTYNSNLGITPRSRNTIKVYLDDTQTDSFNLINDNVTVTLDGTTSEIKTIVDLYTVPAIEARDLVSLTVFNNLY